MFIIFIMKVAIYGKNIDDSFFPCLKQLVVCLQEQEIELVCEEGFASLLKEGCGYEPVFSGFYNKEVALEKDVAMLLSIGGDGTFLDSVVYVKDNGVPVLGVNSGRLGFLANVRANEIQDAVVCIANGNYVTEQREMVELLINGQSVPGFDYALNEVGILKAATSSLLKIHAYIGEEYLTTYWADGLIVATPTGSTAYSLSGGGPIVSPDCKNLILTPICPHNLSMRPLVVPNNAVISLQIESRSGDFVLSMDSRIRKIDARNHLKIYTSGRKVNVVSLQRHSYYGTLRNKLMWGEDKRNSYQQFD